MTEVCFKIIREVDENIDEIRLLYIWEIFCSLFANFHIMKNVQIILTLNIFI